MTTVLVSGGFDPLHVGHVRLVNAAADLGDRLWVILNNDNWLMAKKGYVFMPQAERKEVLKAMRAVERVILTDHADDPDDMSVCPVIHRLRLSTADELIFANGGDVTSANTREHDFCLQTGITLMFNIGGDKVQSSSSLVDNIVRTLDGA